MQYAMYRVRSVEFDGKGIVGDCRRGMAKTQAMKKQQRW